MHPWVASQGEGGGSSRLWLATLLMVVLIPSLAGPVDVQGSEGRQHGGGAIGPLLRLPGGRP